MAAGGLNALRGRRMEDGILQKKFDRFTCGNCFLFNLSVGFSYVFVLFVSYDVINIKQITSKMEATAATGTKPMPILRPTVVALLWLGFQRQLKIPNVTKACRKTSTSWENNSTSILLQGSILSMYTNRTETYTKTL